MHLVKLFAFLLFKFLLLKPQAGHPVPSAVEGDRLRKSFVTSRGVGQRSRDPEKELIRRTDVPWHVPVYLGDIWTSTGQGKEAVDSTKAARV